MDIIKKFRKKTGGEKINVQDKRVNVLLYADAD